MKRISAVAFVAAVLAVGSASVANAAATPDCKHSYGPAPALQTHGVAPSTTNYRVSPDGMIWG